jgi:tetratricopeptide (TPR) repeat protein
VSWASYIYSSAGRFELSKMNFQKYLELTQGNIPAKIRYVTALFYAKEYDEVNKNVDEIMAIDNSRSYMNRIAGYSSYEKEPPDYSKALAYMNTLLKSVSPDRIIKKDYYYMARILLGKNQNYPDLIKENDRCKSLLERENKRYSDATVALKAKLRLNIDSLTIEIANLNTQISKANIEIDSAFVEYDKRLSYDPKDNILLNEIASNYYRYNRFDDAARTWSKMIDLGKNNIGDYMQIGKAYYIGEKYKTADSVFNIIINKDPNYLPAYLMIARTYSKMDPDFKLGIAKPKFEKLINAAKVDSLSNESEMMEAFECLSYFYMMNDNFSRSKDYYIRMINLDPNSKENKIKGYNGIGSVELRSTSTEKTNEGRLPYLSRAADAYNKILAIDPINTLAKGQISYIHYFEAQIKKGINPNEIKGIVKNEAGHPLAYASIRVKDTAVENPTNQRGEYKFEIPQESETLIISAIGYKSKELAISKTKRVYNVTLEQ